MEQTSKIAIPQIWSRSFRQMSIALYLLSSINGARNTNSDHIPNLPFAKNRVIMFIFYFMCITA